MSKNPYAGVRWIWMNGELVEFEKATVHVLTHGLHYGSGLFEGIRCYDTPQGPGVFRLPEHMRRLELSCKIFRTPLPYDQRELCDAVVETIRANELDACYVRPIVFRGFGPLGVNPLDSPVQVAIAVWPWGKYLGEEALSGVDVCVSSWRRARGDVLPALAKATGNYINSQLIKMEAVKNGFVEGIALDPQGNVSEGSGENLFAVVDGRLVTTALSSSILMGITRDSVITLARDLGVELHKEIIPRALLYTCDELFFTGTAAEITPIRTVDKIPVGAPGAACPGPVTQRLMDEFMGIIGGEIEDRHGWFTRVYSEEERMPLATGTEGPA